jgi:hypothetical protein
MAQAPSSTSAPLTEDAFLADRQKFWESFTGFTTGSVFAVVALMVLLAVFLL